MVSLRPNLHLPLQSTRPAAASLCNRCTQRFISTLPRSDSSSTIRNHGKRQQRWAPAHLHHGSLQTVLAGTVAFQPTSDAPSLWLALGAFVGLPLALWIYKCIMMIVFQRKIIYMGYVPMGARSEQLGVDVKPSKDVSCEEVSISGDGKIKLSGIIVRKDTLKEPQTIILYFQGNAGNPLGRIPVFEKLLSAPTLSHSLAILAIAPRSYWKSSSTTPTQPGLTSDYLHALSYASHRFPNASIILYGHSLGGAIVPCLASQLKTKDYPKVKGLVLENPFSSIPGMVRALYPQKWLPYHYLGRLTFDKWDALQAMKSTGQESLLGKLSPSMLVLVSGKDELVPPTMGEQLFHATSATASEVSTKRCVVIKGALHENAWMFRQWNIEMHKYIEEVMDRDS